VTVPGMCSWSPGLSAILTCQPAVWLAVFRIAVSHCVVSSVIAVAAAMLATLTGYWPGIQ